MASSADIQKDLDKAVAALDAGSTSYKYKGATLSLVGLRNLVSRLDTELKTAKSAESKKAKSEKTKTQVAASSKASQARATKTALSRAESKLNLAEQTQANALAKFRNNEITASEYSAYTDEVARYTKIITAIKGGAQAIPIGYDDVRLVSEEAAAPQLGAPSAVLAPSSTTGTETNEPVETTVVPSLDTTGTTVNIKNKGKKTPAPAVTQDNWVDALQKFFPSYSDDWLAANAETYFGKDLIDLMIKVSDPKGVYDLTTAAGVERIQQEIRGTNYWQTTITATKNFDQLIDADKQNLITNTKSRIANTYGDIGLDEQTLTAVASVVARTGLTGLGEKQAVYNAVFKQGAPQAQTGRALEGADADRIRQLGKAWNTNVSEEQIKSILTGTPMAGSGLVLTEEGLRQQLQTKWKGAMPHLAKQFDAGLTLSDIGSTYREYAAQLLEQTPDQIDMFKGPYLQAFGTDQTGQLSLTDWTQKIKSDPKFGWQFTKQANDQATDIALTLARAFGKVQ
jgi:hypothetical protein